MTSAGSLSVAACVMAALRVDALVENVYRIEGWTDFVACLLAFCNHVAASSAFLTISRNESVDVRLLAVDVETSDALRADVGVAIVDELTTLSIPKLLTIEEMSTANLLSWYKTQRFQQEFRGYTVSTV